MIDLIQLQHFHFLRPNFFWVFVALVVILKFFSNRDDTLSVWRKVLSDTILTSLTVPGNSKHRISPHRLSLALAFPVTIILMGPTWQQQPSPFSENNSALIIALDVSETMTQSDIQPTRLIRAKQKINELLKLRGDTNTALIAFSGTAHTVMPISNDSEMIRHFLDVLAPSIMPVSGKLPESILPLSASLLDPTNVPGTLLVIGDGATEQTAEKFSAFFNQYNHQLIVWPIGKSVDDPTLDKNSSIIPLQIAELKNIADKSHGRLVEMTLDKQDILQVNTYIEHNLVVVDDKSRPWLDAGYPFIFIAAGIFLFWFRRGWTLQW